jgi:hypothetical protein
MTRSRLFIIAIAATFLMAGISCSDTSPTGVASTPPVVAPTTPPTSVSPSLIGDLLDGLGKGKLLSPLLQCGPQPYAADTAVIGPAGGRLVIGRHTLVIPAGALDHSVKIIGEAPVGTVVSVRFQPEGLQFNSRHPAKLTLDYRSCPLVRNLVPKRIAYTNESLDILSFLLSIDDLLHRRVTADVKHFSRYAVSW